MRNCSECILDGTDACLRGAGRALRNNPCEAFLTDEDDAISRQALVEWIQDKTFGDIVVASEHNFDCLPPVTPKQKWIPVSERLPEKYKAVIVTDIETNDTYQSQYVGNGYWECDNGLFMDRIIAWMPLPEPYKAESEES